MKYSPSVMLAHVMPEGFVPDGWLASEKLDGIRALWIPSKGLVTRSGNPIHAPAWFLNSLPRNTKLDGELFMGRGKFQRTSSVVRKKVPVDSEWHEIRYHVFDSPGEGSTVERLRRLGPKSGVIVPVKQTIVRSRAHMNQMMGNIIDAGGEGLMVRDGMAPYENKRSRSLLKVKPSLDTEGTVIEILEGKGKYKNKLGKMRLRLKSGKTVLVGTGLSDAQRSEYWTPSFLGTVVTIKYMTLTNGGIPRQPVFNRVRHDFGW